MTARWHQVETVRGLYCRELRLSKSRRRLVWMDLRAALYRVPPRHVMRRDEMGSGSFRERRWGTV